MNAQLKLTKILSDQICNYDLLFKTGTYEFREERKTLVHYLIQNKQHIQNLHTVHTKCHIYELI